MKRPEPSLLVVLPLLALALTRPSRARAAESTERPAYPPTRKTEAADGLHGGTVKDSYRWLEDEKSAEVQAWMKAQDALTRERLKARG